MQYFCYERRAAAGAWIACLYPESPGAGLSKVRRSPIIEVPDEMDLRACMAKYDPPSDTLAVREPKPAPVVGGAAAEPEPEPEPEVAADEPVFKSRRAEVSEYDRG